MKRRNIAKVIKDMSSFQTMVSMIVKVIIGFAIIVIFHFIASYAKTSIQQRSLSKSQLLKEEQHVKDSYIMIGMLIYFGIMAVGILVMMQLLGFQTTSIVAILGTVGLTIGISLQGILNDIASGIVLAFSQKYNVGDIIEVDGKPGKVIEFGMVNTVLSDIYTNNIFIIPNRTIQDSIVINYSKNPIVFVVTDITISNVEKYDYHEIIATIEEDLSSKEKYPDYNREYKAKIGVMNMADNGTTVRIRVPVNNTCMPDCASRIRTELRNLISNKDIKLVYTGD